MITIVDHFSIGSFYDQVPFCTGLTKITVNRSSEQRSYGASPETCIVRTHSVEVTS
jgi:hypothetical protein